MLDITKRGRMDLPHFFWNNQILDKIKLKNVKKFKENCLEEGRNRIMKNQQEETYLTQKLRSVPISLGKTMEPRKEFNIFNIPLSVHIIRDDTEISFRQSQSI